MAVGDNLRQYTYQFLKQMALDEVPDQWDKRQGSMVDLFISPPAYLEALFFLQLYYAYRDTNILTATGEALDYLVASQGLTRYPATFAIRKGEFFDREGIEMDVPIGTRFQTLTSSNNDRLNFVVIEPYLDSSGLPVAGQYRLQCETPGSIGNIFPGTIQQDNNGNLLALDTVNGLATAWLTDLLVPARDEETDEELRTRYLDQVSTKSFGGNITQYLELLHSYAGVGYVQVYPVWNGGGTVGISVLDTNANPISAEFINELEVWLDPENNNGDRALGIGQAPIGHYVTVSTPEEVTINVSANVTLADGFSISATQARVETALQNYINQLRRDWDNPDQYFNYELSVVYAAVIAVIISVDGVLDVSNLLINDGTENIPLTQTGALQQIPVLGTVTISEA